MGVIIYVNEVLEAIRGKKLYSEGKKKAWRSRLFEKCFWQKLFNNLKNPLEGPIRFELQPQIKKDTSQQPPYIFMSLELRLL